MQCTYIHTYTCGIARVHIQQVARGGLIEVYVVRGRRCCYARLIDAVLILIMQRRCGDGIVDDD